MKHITRITDNVFDVILLLLSLNGDKVYSTSIIRATLVHQLCLCHSVVGHRQLMAASNMLHEAIRTTNHINFLCKMLNNIFHYLLRLRKLDKF